MKRLLVLLFVFCAVPAIAQVPSGTFSYVFTNTPLWDTTGSYTNDSDRYGCYRGSATIGQGADHRHPDGNVLSQ